MCRKMVANFTLLPIILVALGVTAVFAQRACNDVCFQFRVGGGTVGNMALSKYRDSWGFPFQLGMDATRLCVPPGAPQRYGVEFINIPLASVSQCTVLSTDFDNCVVPLEWSGSKSAILGNIGYALYHSSDVESYLSLSGGYAWISTSAAKEVAYDSLTNRFAFRDSDSLPGTVGGFTVGLTEKSTIRIQGTPINFWGEAGFYWSALSGDIGALQKPSDASKESILFVLKVGLEINIFRPCDYCWGCWGAPPGK